ncbi:MAG: CPBP family intramembrane glutamic endopeptidase [Anaerolineae bacterium]
MSSLTEWLEQKGVEAPVLRVGLLYLAAVTAAELLTTLVEPRLGLIFHGLLLIVLLVHTARSWEDSSRDLLLTLTFAPLIRMLSLSLPLGSFPLVYWYLITSIPLFVSVVITMRTLGFSWQLVGITPRGLLVQLVASSTGVVFGYVEYLILRPAPLAQAFTWQQLWLPALILMVSTGFMEELIFRGLMQQAAKNALGVLSVPYVAAIFAVLHVGYKSVLDVVFVFVVAMFFGYLTGRTRSIVGASLSHGLTNIVLFLVAPFQL